MQWQSMLRTGNSYFDEKQWLQAEYYYREAYGVLERQWNDAPLETELLMAWICACHNLSTLFEVQGELEVSLQYLKIPHLKLKELAACDTSSEDLKLIAFKALKFTLTPLLSFAKKYPICANCQKDLLTLQQQLAADAMTLH